MAGRNKVERDARQKEQKRKEKIENHKSEEICVCVCVRVSEWKGEWGSGSSNFET